MDEFTSALFLPHTNLALFPSVDKILDPDSPKRGKDD